VFNAKQNHLPIKQKQTNKPITKNKKKTMTNLYIDAIPKVVFESVSIVCGS
jgi:hypothetical protein